MKAKFSFCEPLDIIKSEQAFAYLLGAADGFGGKRSLVRYFDSYDPQTSSFVLVTLHVKLVGAIYLTFTQQEVGKVMSSILLGGDNFGDWAQDLSEFYYKTAKERECVEFNLMGRRGFKKYFPELEEVATVFRVKLTNQI